MHHLKKILDHQLFPHLDDPRLARKDCNALHVDTEMLLNLLMFEENSKQSTDETGRKCHKQDYTHLLYDFTSEIQICLSKLMASHINMVETFSSLI